MDQGLLEKVKFSAEAFNFGSNIDIFEVLAIEAWLPHGSRGSQKAIAPREAVPYKSCADADTLLTHQGGL